MPTEGFVEYKRREYCNDVECPIQMIMNQKEKDSEEYNQLRKICQEHCLHTTYEFHHWLVDEGYLLLRPEKKK
jgi:ferritin